MSEEQATYGMSDGERALRGELAGALARVKAATAACKEAEDDADAILGGLAQRLKLTKAAMRAALIADGTLPPKRTRAVASR